MLSEYRPETLRGSPDAQAPAAKAGWSILTTGARESMTTPRVAVVAVGLAEIAERIYGEKDSHKIVVDEIAGFFVSMAFVPFRPLPVAAAFLLFRIFDVLKPPPIRRLQELRGREMFKCPVGYDQVRLILRNVLNCRPHVNHRHDQAIPDPVEHLARLLKLQDRPACQ